MALRIPFNQRAARPRSSSFSADLGRGGVDYSPIENAIWGLADLWAGQVRADRKVKFDKVTGDTALAARQTALDLALDNDPLNRPAKYEAATAKLREDTVKTLADSGFSNAEIDAWDQSYKASIQGEMFDLRKMALVEQQDRMRAGLEDNLDSFAKLAGEGTVDQDQIYKARGVEALEAAEAGGFITAQERQKRQGSFLSDVDTMRLQMNLLSNPAAALVSLQEGGYGSIEPGKRPSWIAHAQNLVKAEENERKAREREAAAAARARQAEAQTAARMVFEDELAAAQDGKAAHPEAARIILNAFGDKSGPLLDRLNGARETASIANTLGVMTNDQIAGMLNAKAPDGEGYAQEAKDQALLGKVAADVIERRQKDPAAEVMRAFPEVGQRLGSESVSDVASGMRQSIDLQQSVFGFGSDQVLPLPKATAQRVAQQFKEARSREERLGILAPLTASLDDDAMAGRVLSQLRAAGLPAEAEAAMARLRDGDENAALNLMGLIGTDVKAPDAKLLRDEITAQDTVSQGDALMGLWTGNGSFAQRMVEDRDLIERRAAQLQAVGMPESEAVARATQDVRGSRRMLADPEFGAISVPQEIDSDALEAGLVSLRNQLPDLVSPADLAPMLPDSLELPVREMAARDLLEDWAEQGRWVNDGDGFALLIPGLGKLMGPDGKPIRWSIGDAIGADR